MYGQHFGIETEFTGCPCELLFRRLSHPGSSFLPLYRGLNPALQAQRQVMYALRPDPAFAFGIKNDGSVTPPGGEFVSPILTQDDLTLYQSVLDEVRRVGSLRADHSCGLHVHVSLPLSYFDSNRDSGRFEALLWHNWQVVMPRLRRSIHPFPHREARYCRMDVPLSKLSRERYLAINTTQSRHPTIEFRLFNGSLDFRYICRAVRLSTCLVAVTAEHKVLTGVPRYLSVEKYLEEVWTDPHRDETLANSIVDKVLKKQEGLWNHRWQKQVRANEEAERSFPFVPDPGRSGPVDLEPSSEDVRRLWSSADPEVSPTTRVEFQPVSAQTRLGSELPDSTTTFSCRSSDVTGAAGRGWISSGTPI